MVSIFNSVWLLATQDVFLSLWLCLAGFVLYGGCLRSLKEGYYFIPLMMSPVIGIAGFIDVIGNQLLGRLIFLELRSTWTFSQRLSIHASDPSEGWRWRVAKILGGELNTVIAKHILIKEA